MKKRLALDCLDVTGETDLLRTEWDDDLTLRMLERRLVVLFVNVGLSFGKLRFKQGNTNRTFFSSNKFKIFFLGSRYLHKKTKLRELSDDALKISLEVKLDPVQEVEVTSYGCTACNTPYLREFCVFLNYICSQCLEIMDF